MKKKAQILGLFIILIIFLTFSVYAEYCGDGICEGNEVPAGCPEDCGEQSQDDDDGEDDSSGGGACTARWLAGEWSVCGVDGTQTREYYDDNSCGYSYGKPEKDTRNCDENEGTEATCVEEECEDNCEWDSSACACLCHAIEIPKEERCDGCLLNDNCVTFGYRNNGKYCDLSKEFVEQKGNDEKCENSFECKSNLCIDNECIEEGFFSKLISWLKKIFKRR